MAIGAAIKNIALRLLGLTPVATGSVQIGPWQTIHDNVELTASTAAELIRPFSVTAAEVHAVRVPAGATRMMVRVRWSAAGAVATSPVIRAYGVYTPAGGNPGTLNSSEWFDDDGTFQAVRIDRNATGAGGVTVTCDPTNDLRDATYSYSANAIHTDDGTPWFDCKGASYVFVLCSTAASITGSGVIQASFLN